MEVLPGTTVRDSACICINSAQRRIYPIIEATYTLRVPDILGFRGPPKIDINDHPFWLRFQICFRLTKNKNPDLISAYTKM